LIDHQVINISSKQTGDRSILEVVFIILITFSVLPLLLVPTCTMIFSIRSASALAAVSALIFPYVVDAGSGNGGEDAMTPLRLLRSNHTSNWGSQGEIYGPEEGGSYGTAIALDGTGRRIVVGSPYATRDRPDVDRNVWTGFVQVFERVEGTPTWVQLGQDIDGISGSDLFGMEVSISEDGNRIAALAPWYDVAGWDDSDDAGAIGRLRVFDYVAGNWTEVGALTDVKAAVMSADGSRFVVGHPLDVGRAGVFAFDGTAFAQIGGWIDADGEGDSFGESVAISRNGTRVAVGASLYDAEGFMRGDDGEYIYDDAHYAYPFPSCYERGLPQGHQDNANPDFGLVRVYEFAEGPGDWVQLGLDIVGRACDKFGSSIDMSHDGTRIVVGAPEGDYFGRTDDVYEDKFTHNLAGRVQVLDYNGGEWTEVGQEIGGVERIQQLGRSVSISGDGGRIVVASANEYFSDTEEDPVCVYELAGGQWEGVGECILATDVRDNCKAIALDGSGSVVAIGCHGLDWLEEKVGGVRIYFQMDECVEEKNAERLETMDELTDDQVKADEKLVRKHDKKDTKIEEKFDKKRKDCTDVECQEKMDRKEKKRKDANDEKYDGKREDGWNEYSEDGTKAADKFVRKAKNCD